MIKNYGRMPIHQFPNPDEIAMVLDDEDVAVIVNCINENVYCLRHNDSHWSLLVGPDGTKKEAANDVKLVIHANYEDIRAALNESYKRTRRLINSGGEQLDNLAQGYTEADEVIRSFLFNRASSYESDSKDSRT